MLMHLIPQQSRAWATWETRRSREGQWQAVDRGGAPFFLQVPVGDTFTLTDAFRIWQHDHEVRAVSHRGTVLMVQLGRYVEGEKNFARLPWRPPLWFRASAVGYRLSWFHAQHKLLSYTLVSGRLRDIIGRCCEMAQSGDTQMMLSAVSLSCLPKNISGTPTFCC